MAKSVARNRRRSALTILGVAAALFLLVSLRTFLGELEGESTLTPASSLRLVTISSVSMAQQLPISYLQRIKAVPGVDLVTPFQWFGGYYQDPGNFFAQFAVDPVVMRQLASDYTFNADQADDWVKDRTGAWVASKLMNRFGWKIGDRITVIGGLFPFNVQLTIRGTFHGPDENGLFFHYDYFNELQKASTTVAPDRVAAYWIRAKSAADVPKVAATVDAMFRNTDAPTRTDTEKAFSLSFTAMLGNIRLFLSLIAGAVLFAIFLVTANTMAMTVRERSAEVGVLKTIGFRRWQILAMFMGESIGAALLGGLIGVGSAKIIFGNFDWYTHTAGIIQHFNVSTSTVLLGLAVAVALGAVSSAVPAWRASRESIVKALRHVG